MPHPKNFNFHLLVSLLSKIHTYPILPWINHSPLKNSTKGNCESMENEIENIFFLLNQLLYLYIVFYFFKVQKLLCKLACSTQSASASSPFIFYFHFLKFQMQYSS